MYLVSDCIATASYIAKLQITNNLVKLRCELVRPVGMMLKLITLFITVNAAGGIWRCENEALAPTPAPQTTTPTTVPGKVFIGSRKFCPIPLPKPSSCLIKLDKEICIETSTHEHPERKPKLQVGTQIPGIITRWYRTIGRCSAGDPTSSGFAIDIDFISSQHCNLDGKWLISKHYKQTENRTEKVSFPIGTNYTIPRFVMLEEQLQLDEVIENLPERILKDMPVKSYKLNSGRTPSNYYKYIPFKRNEVQSTDDINIEYSSQPGGFPLRGILVQKVIQCAVHVEDIRGENVVEEKISVYTDELDVIPIPHVNCTPGEEYKIVRYNNKTQVNKIDGDIVRYRHKFGVSWTGLEEWKDTFVSRRIDFLEEELRNVYKPVPRDKSFPSRLGYENLFHYMVKTTEDSFKSVSTKDDVSIELHQIVGVCGEFQLYTGLFDEIWYKNNLCVGGTGDLKNCPHVPLPVVGNCKPRDYFKRVLLNGKIRTSASEEKEQKTVYEYKTAGITWRTKTLHNDNYHKDVFDQNIQTLLVNRLHTLGISSATNYDYRNHTVGDLVFRLDGDDDPEEDEIIIPKGVKGKDVRVELYQVVAECGEYQIYMFHLEQRILTDGVCTGGTGHLKDCSIAVCTESECWFNVIGIA